MNECWRPIARTGGHYSVSDAGRIRREQRKCLRKDGRVFTLSQKIVPLSLNRGYPSAVVQIDGETFTIKVHVEVLTAFVSPRPHGFDACHNDGDKENNILGNLRWDSRSENMYDVVRCGNHFHAEQDRCSRGHLKVAPNLRSAPLEKENKRLCKACHYARTDCARHPEYDMKLQSDFRYEKIMANQPIK